jgi:hypothetical protein
MSSQPQADAFIAERVLPSAPAPIDWLDTLPPEADCLRDYQVAQVKKISPAMQAGFRRILVQLPTGGGKTHEIAAIVAAAVRAGLPVLIIATRTRLVRQLHERLKAFGIRHGVIASSLPDLRNYSALVQIASADTLHRRAIVGGKIPLRRLVWSSSTKRTSRPPKPDSTCWIATRMRSGSVSPRPRPENPVNLLARLFSV